MANDDDAWRDPESLDEDGEPQDEIDERMADAKHEARIEMFAIFVMNSAQHMEVEVAEFVSALGECMASLCHNAQFHISKSETHLGTIPTHEDRMTQFKQMVLELVALKDERCSQGHHPNHKADTSKGN